MRILHNTVHFPDEDFIGTAAQFQDDEVMRQALWMLEEKLWEDVHEYVHPPNKRVIRYAVAVFRARPMYDFCPRHTAIIKVYMQLHDGKRREPLANGTGPSARPTEPFDGLIIPAIAKWIEKSRARKQRHCGQAFPFMCPLNVTETADLEVPGGFYIFVLLAASPGINFRLSQGIDDPGVHQEQSCFVNYIREQETSAGSEKGNEDYQMPMV